MRDRRCGKAAADEEAADEEAADEEAAGEVAAGGREMHTVDKAIRSERADQLHERAEDRRGVEQPLDRVELEACRCKAHPESALSQTCWVLWAAHREPRT